MRGAGAWTLVMQAGRLCRVQGELYTVGDPGEEPQD